MPKAIRFRCRECGRRLKAPGQDAGVVFACPGCDAETRVPAMALDDDREEEAVARRSQPERQQSREGIRDGPSRHTVAACAIFLGSLGIHKFMLGCYPAAFITLLSTILGS